MNKAMTTDNGNRVPVSPVLIQAAKLRKTINDRRGVQTSPVTEKIAALEGPRTQTVNGVNGARVNGTAVNGVRHDGTGIAKVNGTEG